MQPDKQKILVVVLVVVAVLLILWQVIAGIQRRKAMEGEFRTEGATAPTPTVAPEFDRIKERMEEEK